MNCWHCDRPAHGTCQFCGRALCKDHVRLMPSVIDIYQTQEGKFKALVVADALYCGVCSPKEDPVELTDLD